MEEIVENESHPFRFMLRFAIFVGILFVIARMLDSKRRELSNLTETEAREKFVNKASTKLGEDQAKEIADQVIPVLIEKGLIKPDPADEAAEKVKDAADDVKDAADEVKDAADDLKDEVAEAVDSVVSDD